MKLNESKVKALQKDALLVSTEAFNQAIKYSFQDTTNNSKDTCFIKSVPLFTRRNQQLNVS